MHYPGRYRPRFQTVPEHKHRLTQILMPTVLLSAAYVLHPDSSMVLIVLIAAGFVY